MACLESQNHNTKHNNKWDSMAQCLPIQMLDPNETVKTTQVAFGNNMVWMAWLKVLLATSSIIIAVIFWDDVILAQILLESVLTFIREQLAPCRQQAHHPCILVSKIVRKFSLLPLHCSQNEAWDHGSI